MSGSWSWKSRSIGTEFVFLLSHSKEGLRLWLTLCDITALPEMPRHILVRMCHKQLPKLVYSICVNSLWYCHCLLNAVCIAVFNWTHYVCLFVLPLQGWQLLSVSCQKLWKVRGLMMWKWFNVVQWSSRWLFQKQFYVCLWHYQEYWDKCVSFFHAR